MPGLKKAFGAYWPSLTVIAVSEREQWLSEGEQDEWPVNTTSALKGY